MTRRQTSTPPPVREGAAEFALVGTTGNASTQSLGVGGELTYRPGSWETQFKANYVRNESEDVLKAETYRFSARAGWA